MKKIAIVGFGHHVKKSILPVINKISDVEVAAVVVKNPKKYTGYSYFFTSDYASVLDDVNIVGVYIATPIATHFEYAKAALKAKKMVLCEKALTESLAKTTTLIEIAKASKTKFEEVVMYQYHNQYQWVVNYLEANSTRNLIKIHARFQIPHLDAADIRYQKDLGGGALLDVGFYPVSALLGLLGQPSGISSIKYTRNNFEVDLSGIAIFDYINCYGIAEWGIGRPYKSEILIEYEDGEVLVERAFSKPASLKTTITIKENNLERKVDLDEDDHFLSLFTCFFECSDFDDSSLNKMLMRSEVLEQIQASAN